jgi:hypothetical protein
VSIPPRWKDQSGFQRTTAQQVNPLLAGYIWQQYASGPSPDPNEGYSYFDLTKHSPGWFDGTAYKYPVAANDDGDVAITGDLDVAGDTTLNTLTVTGASQLNTLAVNAVTGSGSITTTGAIGYRTGAGGTVTQGTSRTTGVQLDKLCGRITLFSAAGSTSWQTFTVTCSQVDAVDTVMVNQKSGTDKYMIHVTRVASGAFDITFATTGGTTSEQPVFNFAIFKAVVS